MEFAILPPSEYEFALSPEVLEAQSITLIDASPLVAELEERFAFPAGLFDDLLFVQPNKKIVRAVSPPLELPSAPRLDRAGIDFMRIDMAVPRMTTAAAMTWGRHAERNVVDTTADQCDRYLKRELFRLDEEQLSRCTDRGSVFIRHYGHGLGLGFLTSTRPADDHFGTVRSLYPKAFAVDLEQTSAFGNPL